MEIAGGKCVTAQMKNVDDDIRSSPSRAQLPGEQGKTTNRFPATL